MKKSEGFIEVLNTGIFYSKILFCVNYSYDEICKVLKKQKCTEWLAGISHDKEFIEESYKVALKRTITKGKDKRVLFYMIFRDRFGFTDKEMCELAHEVVHLCQFILPEFLNRMEEFEAEAYLHTHIMQQALTKLRGK